MISGFRRVLGRLSPLVVSCAVSVALASGCASVSCHPSAAMLADVVGGAVSPIDVPTFDLDSWKKTGVGAECRVIF